MAPRSSAGKEEAFQILAKELSNESPAETILQRLKALNLALEDTMAGAGFVAFARAGGISALIPLLRGTVTSHGAPDADSMSLAVSAGAGHALNRVLNRCAFSSLVILCLRAGRGNPRAYSPPQGYHDVTPHA
jgi:hypothetical protein